MTRIARQLKEQWEEQRVESILVAVGLIAGIIGCYLLTIGYAKEAYGLIILLAFAGGFSYGSYREKRKERTLE